MSSPDIFRFHIGNFECLAISDIVNVIVNEPNRIFQNVRDGVWQAQMVNRGLDPKQIPIAHTCLAINNGDQWILIDTGLGALRKDTQLATILKREQIQPASIILTHAHSDHYGGLTDGNLRPSFPDATVFVCRAEWESYTSETFLTENPDYDIIRERLIPLQDQIEFFEPETEILSGISSIFLPGHTPNHVGIILESEGEILIFSADTFIHQLHLEHLNWQIWIDVDHAQARQSRIKLARIAVEKDALVLAYHLPFPSLGHIQPILDMQWRWQSFQTP